jgi:hypothetical protein
MPTIDRPCANLIFLIEDGILIYCKQLAGSESYARLQLVPAQFRNIIFVAFHSNPIIGHFNPYCTFHCICLCFYWPQMYDYVTWMCKSCPGCALSNPTCTKSCKLVYNFPIVVPMMVLQLMGTRLVVNKALKVQIPISSRVV